MPGHKKIFVAGIKSAHIWDKVEEKENQIAESSDVESDEHEEPETYGLLFEIINAYRPPNPRSKVGYYRPIPFSCFTFAPFNIKKIENSNTSLKSGVGMLAEAINGNLMMAAADQRGCLLIFDFGANKVWQVVRIGIAISAIAFTSLSRNELVVAFTDNTLKSYNIETRQLIAETRSHRKPVEYISMHPTQHLAITSSLSEGILWNMVDWTKVKVLNQLEEGLALRRALFSPSGNYIITIFFNDTICIWNKSNFRLIWKLQAPPRPTPLIYSFNNMPDMACRVIAVSKNEQVIIVGGKITLYVWDFEKRRLLRELSIQSISAGEITRMEIINDDTDLLILTTDGHLLLVDIYQSESNIHQLNIKHSASVKLFEVSPDGKFLVTNTMDEKSILKIWDLEALISDTLQHQYRDSSLRSIPHSINDPRSATSSPPLEDQTKKDEVRIVSTSSEEPVGIPEAPKKEVIKEKEQNEFTLEKPSTVSFDALTIQSMSSASREERREKLIEKLNQYGEYPMKHRVRIWRILLNLPDNQEAYKNLIKKKLEPSIKEILSKRFSAKDPEQLKISAKMELYLSTLIKWGFAPEVVQDWIPAIIFPFMEIFLDSDDILGFEAILTILLNWFQHCWEDYPTAPSRFLNIICNLLERCDQSLYNHFDQCGMILGEHCLWPMILSSFSIIFNKKNWHRLWDHFFSNEEPSMLHYFVVAYMVVMREKLLQITKKKAIIEFFRYMQSADLNHLLKVTYKMQNDSDITPPWLSPKLDIIHFRPLSKTGEYRLVYDESHKPKNNKKNAIRDWILKEEVQIVKQK
ncbi:12476_t:CDS:10 [Ambispora gerdemannii]|uniref:12476_t:CDS:1 n=1 Tax=Ambispora gerdemannii TaxID=144530 RepID=A0A9N9AZZ0_9GLOM|nr:12476_t:CDS:10 [Ambispora gerdemannii]